MKSPDDARTAPVYTVAEAARLAETTTATVTRWFRGQRAARPLFADHRPRDGALRLSFLELVELIVARRFRSCGLSTEQLRQSRELAGELWGVEHPFAELRLRILGCPDADANGASGSVEWPAAQPPLPKFAEFATRALEYDECAGDSATGAWTRRFFPAGESAPLMVDPRFAGGSVTFLNRGLLLDTIVQRWRADESIAFIASDFDLDESAVEAALRYALAA